jgi:hypothetical protein
MGGADPAPGVPQSLVLGYAHITHLRVENDETDETLDMEVDAEMIDRLTTGESS